MQGPLRSPRCSSRPEVRLTSGRRVEASAKAGHAAVVGSVAPHAPQTLKGGGPFFRFDLDKGCYLSDSAHIHW
jgi:hypothetical protein